MTRNSEEIDLDKTENLSPITPETGAKEAAKLFARDAIRDDAAFDREMCRMERGGISIPERKEKTIKYIVAQRKAAEEAVTRHLFATHAKGPLTRLAARNAFFSMLKRILPSFPVVLE